MALDRPIRPPVWTERSEDGISEAWSAAADAAVTAGRVGTTEGRDRQMFALGILDALSWVVNEGVRVGSRSMHRFRCVEDVHEALDGLRAESRRERASRRPYISAFIVVLLWLLGERDSLDYPGRQQGPAS
jgi:hypothetical protein